MFKTEKNAQLVTVPVSIVPAWLHYLHTEGNWKTWYCNSQTTSDVIWVRNFHVCVFRFELCLQGEFILVHIVAIRHRQFCLYCLSPHSVPTTFHLCLVGFLRWRRETETPASPVQGKENPDSWLWRLRCVPQCHALCGPSMGDNELSCKSATLPTVCSEEEMERMTSREWK